jgi:protein SCO1/2
VTENSPTKSSFHTLRLVLWALVGIAIIAAAASFLIPKKAPVPQATVGAPFTLVGSDGKPFSSAMLSGKPYAIYFGFTRCGDVCPTTLARLVKLRREAGVENTFNIVFVTIDPAHDGPAEVGQYAGLFNSPIIGLTGSRAQIDHVKRQYGIFAQPSPHPMAGKEMEHSAVVLLFDRSGKYDGTLSATDPDAAAIAQIKKVSA